MRALELRVGSLEFPSSKDENYRYVSLKEVEWTADEASSGVDAFPLDWTVPQPEEGLRLLLGSQDPQAKQVRDRAFEGIQVEFKAQTLLKEFSQDYFCSLVEQQQGSVVRVPRGFRSAKILRLSECFAQGAGPQTRFSQIVVEADAQVEIFLDLSAVGSETNKKQALVSVLQLQVGAGSRVKLFVEQKLSPNHVFVLRHGATLEKDAELSYWSYHRGAGRGQHRLVCNLEGEGARSEATFGVRAQGNEALDLWVQHHHQVRNTSSDTRAWNVLEDEAVVVFNGMIQISPQGLYTQAYQSNKNLLLSDRAQVHTMPKLEIATDDVKCSHGASVASLDPSQLFYLQSRGIPAEEARRMLVDAFAYPVVSQIPLEQLRSKYLGSSVEDSR